MSMITFIINPAAGTGIVKKIPLIVHEYFSSKKQVYQIRFTEYAGHAKVIVNEEIAKGSEIIVAVGGDGTINEIAQCLLHRQVSLGIIPSGSGNGLARHLGISMNPYKALHTILEGSTVSIDSGEINGKPFFCTAGIGFDAVVAERFSQIKGRGLLNYVKAILGEYKKYTPETIHDEHQNSYEGFLITICNANQYGNNAFICPQAKVNDGHLNIVNISTIPLLGIPKFIIQLFTKKITANSLYKNKSVTNITLKRDKSGPLHLDGDPMEHSSELNIRCVPKSLNVIIN